MHIELIYHGIKSLVIQTANPQGFQQFLNPWRLLRACVPVQS